MLRPFNRPRAVTLFPRSFCRCLRAALRVAYTLVFAGVCSCACVSCH